MIKVIIADDEDLVRAGIRAILESADGVTVIGEARDGAEAVALSKQCNPDVVLMDIQMPRFSGLSATRRLMDESSPPKIIILTTFGMDQNVFEALEAGASGFLLKQLNPHQLIQAIYATAAGETVLSPIVTKQLMSHAAAGRKEPSSELLNRVAKLSSREKDVLMLLGQGMNNSNIARKLHMSESSIKTYVSRVLTKLKLDNRTQAALMASKLNLSDND